MPNNESLCSSCSNKFENTSQIVSNSADVHLHMERGRELTSQPLSRQSLVSVRTFATGSAHEFAETTDSMLPARAPLSLRAAQPTNQIPEDRGSSNVSGPHYLATSILAAGPLAGRSLDALGLFFAPREKTPEELKKEEEAAEKKEREKAADDAIKEAGGEDDIKKKAKDGVSESPKYQDTPHGDIVNANIKSSPDWKEGAPKKDDKPVPQDMGKKCEENRYRVTVKGDYQVNYVFTYEKKFTVPKGMNSKLFAESLSAKVTKIFEAAIKDLMKLDPLPPPSDFYPQLAEQLKSQYAAYFPCPDNCILTVEVVESNLAADKPSDPTGSCSQKGVAEEDRKTGITTVTISCRYTCSVIVRGTAVFDAWCKAK